jgi:hypothetical protein
MGTSLLDMARIALIAGSTFAPLRIGFLVKGIARMGRGESFFGKGGSSSYTLLGFALSAMESPCFSSVSSGSPCDLPFSPPGQKPPRYHKKRIRLTCARLAASLPQPDGRRR